MDVLQEVHSFLEEEYPLHKAARLGRLDLLEALVKVGLPVNSVNFDQVTPLHEACFHGHLHCAEFLLENNASVNYRNIDGSTPLCEASAMGQIDCVKLLLKHEASVNPPFTLCTPLHEAVIRGQAECAQVLIDAGAKLDVSDCHFGTPLHAACFRNSVACSEVLLRAGASVNATKIHRSALHIAAFHGYEELTLLLLEFGANVYLQDNQGKRPFQLAPSGSRLANTLKYYEANPGTLMHLCRLRIRQLLGPKNLSYINRFDLPIILKGYLKHV